MAVVNSPIICTPEVILPSIQCLICGRSRQQLLAAFDALLCSTLNRENCTVSGLLPYGNPYVNFSDRELSAAAAYLWFVLLTTESPNTEANEQAISGSVSVFYGRSEVEILAMQLWFLCQLGGGECDADTLIDAGRCYCVSIRQLLAIRVYLLGQYVNNFVEVNMDPETLKAHALDLLGRYSISTLEAAIVWAICQIYNVALENQTPT